MVSAAVETESNLLQHVDLLLDLLVLGLKVILVAQPQLVPLAVYNAVDDPLQALLVGDHGLSQVALCSFVIGLDVLLEGVVAATNADLNDVPDELAVEDLVAHKVLSAADVNYWDL